MFMVSKLWEALYERTQGKSQPQSAPGCPKLGVRALRTMASILQQRGTLKEPIKLRVGTLNRFGGELNFSHCKVWMSCSHLPQATLLLWGNFCYRWFCASTIVLVHALEPCFLCVRVGMRGGCLDYTGKSLYKWIQVFSHGRARLSNCCMHLAPLSFLHVLSPHQT